MIYYRIEKKIPLVFPEITDDVVRTRDPRIAYLPI